MDFNNLKIILFIFFTSSFYAEGVSTLYDVKQIAELSKNTTWLKLLHYKENKSTLLDKGFFLDDKGNLSAKKELEKTIEAYYKPFVDEASYAQCRFPARYFWLSSQIDLANYRPINPKCTKLRKWKLLKNVNSLSVVFVSGYLGNPASAFGHSFIKVNQSENDNNLFDTSISYGALLPSKYGMPEYIFNGLTGGYTAAYTDKYYYNEDVTYSNQEHRDMWEYRLDLKKDKIQFFLLHAWELMGKKFQYFFLNRNCGYKVSEFLELIYDEKILDNEMIWYAPIETIHKLKKFDEDNNNTIAKVNYIPSKQQQIYAHYKGLNKNEKRMVEQIITENLRAISKKSELSKIEKANSLDFVLAYYKYLNPLSTNRSLLLNRLKFPMRKKAIQKVETKRDIADSNKPSYLGLSKSKDSINLHWSPFALELEGYNGLDGNELVLFDTRINMEEGDMSLEKFDLIRIQTLKTKQLPFEEENPFSWRLDIGTRFLSHRDYFAEFGFGLAEELTDNIKVYSMINMSVHSFNEHYRFMPEIGLFANYDKFRLSSNIGYETGLFKENYEKVIELKAQYQMSKNSSCFVDYELREEELVHFGMKWFY